MAKITWDAPAERNFTTGVDRGVFYPQNDVGVPWNGLVSVKESTENAGKSVTYIDGEAVVNRLNLGDFAASIDAFTYPDEFMPYDGYAETLYSGQPRPLFNFSYRTLNGVGDGYQLHLVYNCQADPTNRDGNSINGGSDISTFSWNVTTTPVPVEDARASAHFIIDTDTCIPGMVSAIESYIYGTDNTDPLFPAIDQLLGIFEQNSIYIITDLGDGTWTAEGPDEAFTLVGYEFTLDWPWVRYLDPGTYQIKSY